MAEREHEYLGDGVYASWDGWQIWLRTGSHTSEHGIALEPAVFAALVKYERRVWDTAEAELDKAIPEAEP